MWWILIVIIVILVIYLVSRDYTTEVKANVTNQGGMQEKYRVLLEYLTNQPSTRITKLTKDHVSVSSPIMTFYLDYVGGNTEVEVKGIMPAHGNFARKWKFPQGYSQQNMIQEIESYFDWLVEKTTCKEEALRTFTLEMFKSEMKICRIKFIFNGTGDKYVVDENGNKVAIIDDSINSMEEVVKPVICHFKCADRYYYKLCSNKDGKYSPIFTL